MYRFWVIITYFPKFKEVMWPWSHPLKGQFVILVLKHYIANHCTKFEVSHFSHFGDILLETKNLNGSRDNNHTPFRDECRRCAGTSYDSAVCEIWNLYVHLLRRYQRKATNNVEIGVVLGLGVTQDHRQHSHLIEHIWLPIQLS